MARARWARLGAGWQARLRRIGMGAQNALDIVRMGQLGAPYGAPFDVAYEDRVYRLRHYDGPGRKAPDTPVLLLVPPLMVTAEIYDISPELSAVTRLTEERVDVWLVDFGAPERAEGGMQRTLDDHVRAVDDAIDRVRDATGTDVHLAGYSQGGMFCYQVAAYRRSAGLASLITFGSPVDIHRSIPGLMDRAAGQIIDAASALIERPLERIEGLPGVLTSTGFKVLSVRKEMQQLADFVRMLHDRQALERHERSRRFLAGEGFVAWPGPALRKFVDDFIVNNRMASGGFVIEGRTVTLADITCPILYFVGLRDDIARAPAVRAVTRAAPNAEVHEAPIRAGHFGLVVGSRSLSETWPTVVEWVRWRDRGGEQPALLARPHGQPALEDPVEADFEDVQLDLELFFDVLRGGLETAWDRVGDVSKDVTRAVDNLRWQIPRLLELRRIDATTRVSPGRALAKQAAAIPEETFFLWKGRAFTYADADRRVDNVVRGLIACGVEPGQQVGVLMGRRPSYLSIVTALSRLGAVAALIGPDMQRVSVQRALRLVDLDHVVADPDTAAQARDAVDVPVLVLGGGGPHRTLPEGVTDMEAIDPDAVEVPSWYEPNPGKARELALIIFTAGKDESPRAARITNRRWAVSAFGAAATATLTPHDTVYCCLPLHHAAGMLVSVGGAIVGGSRLALATRFAPEVFWPEVRRYGATVVFYAGDMLRALTDAPVTAGEDRNPVRLFAGSGMRVDVWRRLLERFGSVGVLEFYATTEGNAVLANASGEKIGALGRPLPGSNEMAVVRWDFERHRMVRGSDGWAERCRAGEPGVLVARVDSAHPMAGFDGYADQGEGARRLRRNVLEPDDTWFVSGDLVRVDEDGDYWFVDRIADMIRTRSGPRSSRAIEDAVSALPEIGRCAVYPVADGDAEWEVPVAAVELRADPEPSRADLREAVEHLHPDARPIAVRIVEQIPVSDGFRPLKSVLRRDGLGLPGERVLRLDGGPEPVRPATR
ncbi:MAG: AMP-binding protein [Polyangiales bacterium]